MSEMKIEIIGLERFAQSAQAIFDAEKTMKRILYDEVKIYGQILERQAKEKHLSGPTTDHSLSVRRGRLISSIRALVEDDENTITIRFGTDVPYAAIHEFGGAVKMPARQGGFVGKVLGRKGAASGYEIVMPQRSFLGSSIDETYPDFQTRVALVLENFAARGLRGE